MANSKKYSENDIRIVNLKDCGKVIARNYIQTCFYGWAASENWNPGKYDMSLYFEIYPDAFYMLEVRVGNTMQYDPAAIIFAPYDSVTNQASIGAYISESTKYRGCGFGYRLWKHVFDQLKTQNPNSVRHLYGVPEQVYNYQKSGFRETHNIIHYSMSTQQKYGPFRNAIEKYNSSKAPAVCVLDYLRNKYSDGFARFVDLVSKQQNVCILVSIDLELYQINGVGMYRPLHNTNTYRYSIVANKGNVSVADDLFRALNRNLHNSEVVIDVREHSPMKPVYDHYVVHPGARGQHWTTEMNTLGSSIDSGSVEVFAEPSLETNFLKK